MILTAHLIPCNCRTPLSVTLASAAPWFGRCLSRELPPPLLIRSTWPGAAVPLDCDRSGVHVVGGITNHYYYFTGMATKRGFDQAVRPPQYIYIFSTNLCTGALMGVLHCLLKITCTSTCTR